MNWSSNHAEIIFLCEDVKGGGHLEMQTGIRCSYDRQEWKSIPQRVEMASLHFMEVVSNWSPWPTWSTRFSIPYLCSSSFIVFSQQAHKLRHRWHINMSHPPRPPQLREQLVPSALSVSPVIYASGAAARRRQGRIWCGHAVQTTNGPWGYTRVCVCVCSPKPQACSLWAADFFVICGLMSHRHGSSLYAPEVNRCVSYDANASFFPFPSNVVNDM